MSWGFLNVVLGSVVISSVAPIEDASVRHHNICDCSQLCNFFYL